VCDALLTTPQRDNGVITFHLSAAAYVFVIRIICERGKLVTDRYELRDSRNDMPTPLLNFVGIMRGADRAGMVKT
jgi:hypothetical protein